MASYTTFICDNCKHSWNDRDPARPQQVNIELRVNFRSDKPNPERWSPTTVDQTWCRPCFDNLKPANFWSNTKDEGKVDLLTQVLESFAYTKPATSA